MNVKDVMTPHVLTVTPDEVGFCGCSADVAEENQRPSRRRRSGDLVGIVSEGDFLSRAETGTKRHGQSGMKPFSAQVGLRTSTLIHRPQGSRYHDGRSADGDTECAAGRSRTTHGASPVKRVPVVSPERSSASLRQQSASRHGQFVHEIAPVFTRRHDHSRAISC